MKISSFNFRAFDTVTKRMSKTWNLPDAHGNDLFDFGNDGENYLIDGLKIMQSTGRTDNSGKEIFQGDIVRYVGKTNDDGKEHIAEVCFHELLLGWYLYDKGYVKLVSSVVTEVIGNIYENPELLK